MTFVVLSIAFYLSGVVSGKTIMSSNILSDVFAGTPLLQEYYFWLVVFFGISAIFSFQDVTATKSV